MAVMAGGSIPAHRPRAPRWNVFAAWFVLLVGVVVSGAAGVVTAADAGSTPLRVPDTAVTLLVHLGAFMFVAVGALLIGRQGRNPVGWLLSFYGLLLTNGLVASTFVARVHIGRPLPGTHLILWFGSWGWAIGLTALAALLAVFPSGRLPSSRWRWLTWAGAGSLLSWATVGMLEWPLRGAVLWAVEGHPGLAAIPAAVGGVLLIATLLGGVSALVVRFRRARGVERLQLKWLAFAATIVVAGAMSVLLTGSAPESGAGRPAPLLLGVGIVCIPLAVGVAVLRYRLYEIDRIISRTVAWTLITGLLVGVYLASVIALQAALRPVAGDSDLAVAGSTLVVAALFRTLRGRVQTIVDRRFNRSRYDAQRTVEAFQAHTRKHVDLEVLGGHLIEAARNTVQPAQASLWLRSHDGAALPKRS